MGVYFCRKHRLGLLRPFEQHLSGFGYNNTTLISYQMMHTCVLNYTEGDINIYIIFLRDM